VKESPVIELTPQQQQFVDAQVASGSFHDPSAVVQAGIELLRRAAAGEHAQTAEELAAAIPDIESKRGKTIEAVESAIRQKLNLGQRA